MALWRCLDRLVSSSKLTSCCSIMWFTTFCGVDFWHGILMRMCGIARRDFGLGSQEVRVNHITVHDAHGGCKQEVEAGHLFAHSGVAPRRNLAPEMAGVGVALGPTLLQIRHHQNSLRNSWVPLSGCLRRSRSAIRRWPLRFGMSGVNV